MQDQINPKSSDLVDCSVQTADGKKIPIDSKFFSQQYDDYQDSKTKADRDRALNKLKNSLLSEAAEIQKKYILDGITYKLAILYLPSEKLITLVDLIEGIRPKLLSEHQVFVLGPSSLAAFLETVRMGHETYTLNEKAEKVSQILNEIKDEFSNWSGAINELEKAAEQTVSKVANYKTRENALGRKINKIEDISEE
jgi:DNA recombination protein RmuC